MINDYMNLGVPLIAFLIGIYFGINTVKFFSSEILSTLENAFEKQLEEHKNYVEKSLNMQILEINKKVKYQDQIIDNFKSINLYLSSTSQKVLQLSQELDKKKELETEIIKLKKIIERMEKKR